MKASDFKPAGQLALRLGIKCVVYGPPGGGKTPLLNTVPRPVLLATEPGLLSMSGSTIPTCAAYDTKTIKDFFDWLKSSAEVKNYDTVCIDSGSQLAETILSAEKKSNTHGKKAYGELADKTMEYMNQLFYMQQKHVVIIAKMMKDEELQHDFSGPMPKTVQVFKKKPYFPGQALNIAIPHLFDEILYVDKGQVPNVQGDRTPYIRTVESGDIFARDRSGKLTEYMQHDLNYLFKTIMG